MGQHYRIERSTMERVMTTLGQLPYHAVHELIAQVQKSTTGPHDDVVEPATAEKPVLETHT